MIRRRQEVLFSDLDSAPSVSPESSSTFAKNMTLPVHRWFRYSAGFSAEWVEHVIRAYTRHGVNAGVRSLCGICDDVVGSRESWCRKPGA